MEEKSLVMIRQVLPEQWVIREYRPDYGVDIMIEIFHANTDSEEGISETLGDWVFAQVKSIKETHIQKRRVYPRDNVEKVAPSYNRTVKSRPEEFLQIDVIPYRMETSELLTIQSFGVAVPVLLLLVTLDTGKIYFVCLNDLIDKCLVHEARSFETQKTKTVHIPLANEISRNKDSLTPLRFIAKRAKMYAAFAKFSYQQHEITYLLRDEMLRRDSASFTRRNRQSRRTPQVRIGLQDLGTIRQFLQIIKVYDFWQTTDMWKPVPELYASILQTESLLELEIKAEQAVGTAEVETLSPSLILELEISKLWPRLRNLGHMYEEICREWFLPTYLAEITRPPNLLTDDSQTSLHD